MTQEDFNKSAKKRLKAFFSPLGFNEDSYFFDLFEMRDTFKEEFQGFYCSFSLWKGNKPLIEVSNESKNLNVLFNQMFLDIERYEEGLVN